MLLKMIFRRAFSSLILKNSNLEKSTREVFCDLQKKKIRIDDINPKKMNTSISAMEKMLTVQLLRDYCYLHALKVSGTKLDLIKRVRGHWGLNDVDLPIIKSNLKNIDDSKNNSRL